MGVAPCDSQQKATDCVTRRRRRPISLGDSGGPRLESLNRGYFLKFRGEAMKLRRGFLTAFSRRRGLQSGVTTIEYAIMLVLIAISVAAFGQGLSGSVTSVYSRMIVALTGEVKCCD